MAGQHHHNHSHDHNHAHTANKRALFIGFLITAGFMFAEAIGGLVTNSLALLSDAGHMLSDSISLGVGVLAFALSAKLANYNKTYGYKRVEILAAFFNGVTLLIISIFIMMEAVERFVNPPEVASAGMFWIAVLGLFVNIFVAWVLHHGDTEENLNMRAAFLHVLGDLLGSVGAIIAALCIRFFGWGWADPLASVVVAVLIMVSGFRVTKESVHVLMEGTPGNVNIQKVIKNITNIPGIASIHDLHVWAITSGHNALSCHAVIEKDLSFTESQNILRSIETGLKELNIHHVTIQIENEHHNHADSVLCQNCFESQHNYPHVQHDH